MINNGIKTADNLVETNRNWILNKFNINVLRTREELRGISCYPISSVSEPRKSIRVSRSFKKDINSYENLEKYINVIGSEYLNDIRKKNIPVVFVSGHFNNFELMAMEIEKAGINLCAIYRPLEDVILFYQRLACYLQKLWVLMKKNLKD